MIQTVSEAVSILEQPSQTAREREDAIRFLSNHPSEEGAERLVAALSDDDAGVRWAAAHALIEYGAVALRPLLRALTERSGDFNLREGAHHVLCENINAEIRQQTGELIKSLRGPGADVATMQSASKLYVRLGK